ncbi:MAG: hypothetical protein QM504_03950 [Pseudomonadota bacterium]
MDQSNDTIKAQEAEKILEVSDAKESQEFLLNQTIELTKKLEAVTEKDSIKRADVLLNLANSELGRNKMQEAWTHAKQAFDIYIKHESWEEAVEACDLLYQTDLPSSISALGHGTWLAVTFPVSAQHTINILHNIVTETPDNSDGAALAAIVAHYVVDLRCEGKQKQDLQFITKNMLVKVAKRHSMVESQTGLDVWMDKLELKDPDVFFPRFSLVIGAIVGDNWWYDRDELRTKIPQ